MKRERGKCRICRSLRTKLFLKGEKCFTQKCPFSRRPYPPGEKPKKRKSLPSEFAQILKEKQKLKAFYGLTERELKRYAKEVLHQKSAKTEMSALLLDKLERRLDSIVLRAGFVTSRGQARQLISHGFFEVDGRKVNVPSFLVKVGESVRLRQIKMKKKIVEKIKENLKEAKPPSFLELEPERLEAKLISPIKVEEVLPPAEISSVFAFYSK